MLLIFIYLFIVKFEISVNYGIVLGVTQELSETFFSWCPSYLRGSFCRDSKLLDVIALTVDLPEYNLLRGQVGTIVELLADVAVFEVEFSDLNGQIYESVGLLPAQIMVLYFDLASPNFVPEMVTA